MYLKLKCFDLWFWQEITTVDSAFRFYPTVPINFWNLSDFSSSCYTSEIFENPSKSGTV